MLYALVVFIAAIVTTAIAAKPLTVVNAIVIALAVVVPLVAYLVATGAPQNIPAVLATAPAYVFGVVAGRKLTTALG